MGLVGMFRHNVVSSTGAIVLSEYRVPSPVPVWIAIRRVAAELELPVEVVRIGAEIDLDPNGTALPNAAAGSCTNTCSCESGRPRASDIGPFARYFPVRTFQ